MSGHDHHHDHECEHTPERTDDIRGEGRGDREPLGHARSLEIHPVRREGKLLEGIAVDGIRDRQRRLGLERCRRAEGQPRRCAADRAIEGGARLA